MENSLTVPQKLNIVLPYDLAIPLLGIHPKELKAGTEIFYTHVHRRIIHHSQKVDTTTSSKDEWIKKSGPSMHWNIIQS